MNPASIHISNHHLNYNEKVTKRKVRALIAMLVILAAIVLLAWGFWPFEPVRQIISLPGGSLIVP